MACVGDSIQTSQEANNTLDNRGAVNNVGQSFIIPDDATICAASFFGGKGGSSGIFNVELRSGSYGGTVIATTSSIDSGTLSSYLSPVWQKIEFNATVDLTAGTTYYLRFNLLSGSSNDIIRLGRNSNVYADGQWYFNATAFSSLDLQFRIHGVAASGGTAYRRLQPFAGL